LNSWLASHQLAAVVATIYSALFTVYRILFQVIALLPRSSERWPKVGGVIRLVHFCLDARYKDEPGTVKPPFSHGLLAPENFHGGQEDPGGLP